MYFLPAENQIQADFKTLLVFYTQVKTNKSLGKTKKNKIKNRPRALKF